MVLVVDVVLEVVGGIFSFSSDDDPVGTEHNPQQPPYKSNYSVANRCLRPHPRTIIYRMTKLVITPLKI